jgi:branched-subunit amino acid aminotransferase/4-amino-4-deoxychorismate lyase
MGLLPGVLRADLLARGEAREAPLRVQDALAASVAGTLFVGNALRGLLPAEIVQ